MIRHLLMESNISAIMMLKWSWGSAEYAEHAEYAEYAKPQLTPGPVVPLAMFLNFYVILFMRVSSSCMFHLGSRVSLYHTAKTGWCVHEVSGTRKSFLLTTFSQICSQELSRSVFGLQDFFFKLPLLSPRGRLFYWSKVDLNIQILQKTAFWLVKDRLH